MNILKKYGKKKVIISAAALVTVVCIILSLVLIPRSRAKMPESTEEVVTQLISATAERGSVARELITGGTVADSDSRSVTLAGAVELTGWAVSEGDYVEAGQLLATVGKASVLAAIEDVNDLIKTLDSAIQSSRYDTVDSSIRAPREGRVKAIYAEAGKSVADTMSEHGALMLLSLDGLMAVDIDTAALPLGAAVTVVLPDGTEQSGQVSAVSDGTATVTLTDETALPGDTAVILLDGESAGNGMLYIHSELRVTGFAGTVSRVNVALNAPVSASNSLITLTGTEYTGRYATLLSRRHELEDELQALFAAYETGGVYADIAGRVSGLNEDIVTEDGGSADSSTSTTTVTASAMAYTGAAYSPARLLLAAENKRAARLLLLSDTGDVTPVSPSEDETSGSGDSGDSGGGSSSSGGTGGETPDPGTASVEYIGRVSRVTGNGDGTHTIVISYDGGELTVSTADLTGKTGSTDPLGIKQGDILALRFENGALVSASVYQSSGDTPSDGGTQPGADSAAGGMSGGMSGMAGGTDASGAAQSESAADYTVEETILCTLTPYDTAEIAVSVDELDIRSLAVGQSVSVTFDALPGQGVEGEITAIDPTGENDGGSTKYSVTVSVPRSEDMLTGMTASVRRAVEERDDTVVIPAAALNEDASGVFVYTGYDKRSDELTDPVYVTTGLSDGEYVEILSGITDGDVYCYRYADTIKYSFTG